MEYRKYYSYTYSDWKRELQDSHFSKYLLHKEIMYKLRTYACLFNRDMRKKYINEKSYCAHCFTNEHLTIDHIIPISKGGKNVERNIQILCRKCNRKKGNKI